MIGCCNNGFSPLPSTTGVICGPDISTWNGLTMNVISIRKNACTVIMIATT